MTSPNVLVVESPTPKSGAAAAIDDAAEWLLQNQEPEGYWVGVLETNSCMEAQWILAMHFLGLTDDPKRPGVVRCILNEQRLDGSWEVYHDAPAGDINSTVECYAALRAAGCDPDDEALVRARAWILDRGGLSQTRVFTRFWLALIGEWPWASLPILPPELIGSPNWFPINIYDFASWARATIVPLSILSARQPVRPLPAQSRLDELFPYGRTEFDYGASPKKKLFSWEGIFVMLDKLLNKYSRFPIHPGREWSIRLAIEWIVKHQDADGAWGGIQPPWIYALLALNVEGYSLSHPVIVSGLKAFDAHWSYERNGGVYLQASESPVWDTIWSLIALLESGRPLASCPNMQRALKWLLSKQVTAPGDWAINAPNVRPGGWSFQRANDSYPDIDDTAVCMLTLLLAREQLDGSGRAAIDAALEPATEWILAMQCSNGGWASFDRDNTSRLVTKLPFCDFGEVLDPPTVDVTAHVVETLAHLGFTATNPAVDRALRFIRDQQESDGSWFGRWGVNHIYGTAAVLPALAALGLDTNAAYIRKAADWIVAHQNTDGGWGETPASYVDDQLRGVGESTASQTAWALMALLVIQTRAYDAAIQRGTEFLLSRQVQGTWHEPQYTGTGFPGYGIGSRSKSDAAPEILDQGTEMARGFMLNYNLYRHYFPLIALARSRAHFEQE
ncbi:MAG TPA: squalene--hopene cyclase [Blastocatellia bacterium]|nr:squalene--hopene cyclase [Blastocatellia bacterium]